MTFVFPEKSRAEKDRMMTNLHGTLSIEDLRYLRLIHKSYVENSHNGESLPFGSDDANKAHILGEKYQTDDAEADFTGRSGCSRCRVVKSKNSDTGNLGDQVRLIRHDSRSGSTSNQMSWVEIGKTRVIFRPLTFNLFFGASSDQ